MLFPHFQGISLACVDKSCCFKTHTHKTSNLLGEISGSHGSEYKDDWLLGCCAVLSGRGLPMAQHPRRQSSSRVTFPRVCLNIILKIETIKA
jgi:hypothetical protein